MFSSFVTVQTADKTASSQAKLSMLASTVSLFYTVKQQPVIYITQVSFHACCTTVINQFAVCPHLTKKKKKQLSPKTENQTLNKQTVK